MYFQAAMDHIASLVNSDIGKEFIELWQVNRIEFDCFFHDYGWLQKPYLPQSRD